MLYGTCSKLDHLYNVCGFFFFFPLNTIDQCKTEQRVRALDRGRWQVIGKAAETWEGANFIYFQC